jgi:hypothetical protein
MSLGGLLKEIGTEAAEAALKDPDLLTSIFETVKRIVSGDADGAKAEAEKAANRAAGLASFEATANAARERALARERGG